MSRYVTAMGEVQPAQPWDEEMVALRSEAQAREETGRKVALGLSVFSLLSIGVLGWGAYRAVKKITK